MPRMRTLHAEFFSDVLMTSLDPWERLFFMATWCFADDFGRGRAMMREIAGFAFPHDEEIVVRPFFDKLVALGKLHAYTVNDTPYYHLPNWYKYQKPNRPTRSKLPRPTIDNCAACQALLEADKPFIDRFEFMLPPRGEKSSNRIDWAALMPVAEAAYAQQLREGIAEPVMNLSRLAHEGVMSESPKESESSVSFPNGSLNTEKTSLKDSGDSTRRNQEVGSRNQEVGTTTCAADAAGADVVFTSEDDFPPHVPRHVRRELLADPGGPPAHLEGFGDLQARYIAYTGRGGVVLPEFRRNELRAMLSNLGITAREAIAMFDRYDAECAKSGKAAAAAVSSPNFFQAVFQAYLAGETRPAGKAALQPKANRFGAYTKRSS